ncbi:MAG TPA: amidohydrolase family protein [Iamia sp.]|jgi:imidazolonepropionase-like amidohydrolase|nr:amidohydrolase family protein [Iamia sp.]
MARILFHGGLLFDGTGADPAPADVVIDDERIAHVGAPGTGDGDTSVDLDGKTLLPGLFDCHVHVTFDVLDVMAAIQEPFSYRFYVAARSLQRTLEAGITSVRDAAGADAGVRRAVDEGMIPGPRMQIAIDMLSQTGGHGDEHFGCGFHIPLISPSYPGHPMATVDGPEEMRKMVRTLIREGADVLKVATSGGVLSPLSDPKRAQLRPSELEVLVEEATAAGKFVMAHAQASDGIKNAVRAGIRSIEHGIYLDDEAIQLMLDRGTWLVPTLIAPIWVLESVDAGARLTVAQVHKARMVVDEHAASFRRAVEAGVKIAMGTDAGVGPHGDNLRELELMQAGGQSPTEVLRSTTQEAARLLGVDDQRGTVEEGKDADLVVIDGDALAFAGLKDRVEQVWKAGQRVV